MAALGVVVLVVLAGAAALGGWLSTRSSGTVDAAAAQRLVSGALAAAGRAGSFHYVSSSTGGGISQTTVGDAGPTGGRQLITVNGDTFTVLVVGADAYFRGDALAMVQNLGIPASVARAHSGQWISLTTADAPYQSVYAAVKTSDALRDNITFSPRAELGTSTVAGQKVIAVQGAMQGIQGQPAHGTGTLYLAAGGRHLPVRYVESGTVGRGTNTTSLRFQFDFSAWGRAVAVVPPPSPVPFSALGVPGGGPPGSTPTTLLT